MASEEVKDNAQLKATMLNCNLKPTDADDFAEFEATLAKIDCILQNKAPSDDEDSKAGGDAKEKINFDNLDVDKVRLKVKENRTVINKKTLDEDNEKQVKEMNQKSFMEQVEKDANDRAEARAKAEYEAELQRSQGNEAFRSQKYEKAILHYDKAIIKVKDSAITYCNRALCYIKLQNYKRALKDCQYVLEKLQETNLRAWLYQAHAHKGLKQDDKFEESVAKAREHNPKQLAYIDKYIKQLEAES
ncbi:tetratricopeptide repeat protein 12 [Drosophila sechellia]|uniref:GM26628 n=1 Tax=Drosophila sechellia TaxID=7238 RepID=B4HHK6_DROSE|nr:tetratricopeptide repeat protein 12 [Drosophila sechellia]EDW43548.1 GM26628 [Drosophila sechellia]